MDIKVIDENRSPIECVVSLSAEETAVLARGAWIRMERLHGTMPQALLDEATKERREEFRGELASKGQTYREYRIEHGVKPAEVEERLEAEARKALEEDIALDLAFMRKGLEATEGDEFAALSRLKPGSEIELKREFLETGHACLLRQEARRGAAVRWAVENLVQ